jgi:hypothetical protein
VYGQKQFHPTRRAQLVARITDTMAVNSTPFPTLVFDPADLWEWPAPPLDWPHEPPPIKGTPQPCSVEAVWQKVFGEMLG